MNNRTPCLTPKSGVLLDYLCVLCVHIHVNVGIQVEVRCNPSLNTKCSCGEGGREGERQGGREDADARSQCKTGR